MFYDKIKKKHKVEILNKNSLTFHPVENLWEYSAETFGGFTT